MIGLAIGFCFAVLVILGANNVAGTFWALPFLVVVLAVGFVLARMDAESRQR